MPSGIIAGFVGGTHCPGQLGIGDILLGHVPFAGGVEPRLHVRFRLRGIRRPYSPALVFPFDMACSGEHLARKQPARRPVPSPNLLSSSQPVIAPSDASPITNTMNFFIRFRICRLIPGCPLIVDVDQTELQVEFQVEAVVQLDLVVAAVAVDGRRSCFWGNSWSHNRGSAAVRWRPAPRRICIRRLSTRRSWRIRPSRR